MSSMSLTEILSEEQILDFIDLEYQFFPQNFQKKRLEQYDFDIRSLVL